jgi:hypothetical protein
LVPFLTVGLEPITMMTSAFATSSTGFDTAPEPIHSSSAATDEAWHKRVQWSTLLVPKPVRTGVLEQIGLLVSRRRGASPSKPRMSAMESRSIGHPLGAILLFFLTFLKATGATVIPRAPL